MYSTGLLRFLPDANNFPPARFPLPHVCPINVGATQTFSCGYCTMSLNLTKKASPVLFPLHEFFRITARGKCEGKAESS
eukprot:scaffold8505_cov130-Cylindrotheca_fusiformis.AAC.6